MSKFLNNHVMIAIAAASVFVTATPALADNPTHQAPASAVVSASPTSGGYVISWTDPLSVSAIELYIGHGQRGGYVSRINVGAAKSVKVPAEGVRFNFVTTNGQFLHLECGGNDRTTMPTFRGLKVDCSYIGASGQAEGALVITS